jgi:8-oxo-dGTP pyrophosphatase MutT (NUDIX family)
MADLTPERYAYLAEGNAKQARKRVAVKVLIRDQDDQVLLVNPTYKDFWDLPGGMAEANEPPIAAAERELAEELSLKLTLGRLLVVTWVGPHDPWDDQLIFVFDGGTLDEHQAAGLHLSDSELSDYAFVPLDQAVTMLRPDVHDLLDLARRSAKRAITAYKEISRAV